MIKKLKMRFVIVNMIILSLILLSTLSGIYLLMVNSEISMSEEIMDTLIENHRKSIPSPEKRPPNPPADIKPVLYSPDNNSIIPVKLNNPAPDANTDNNNNENPGYYQDGHGYDWGNAYWGNPYWSYPYWGNPYWNNWGDWGNGGDFQWPPTDEGYIPEYPPVQTEPPVQSDVSSQPHETTPPVQTDTTSVASEITSATVPIQTETLPPVEETTYIEDQTVPVTQPIVTEPPVIVTELPVNTTVTTTVESTTTSVSVTTPEETKAVTTRYNGNLIRSHIFAELGDQKEILNISYQYFFHYGNDNGENINYDAQIRDVIKDISESGKTSGKCVINTVSYRYKLSKAPDTRHLSIIFLDRSIEISTLNRLLIIFVIIGCAGLIIVFFISLFLANWAIKPIEDAWNKQKQFIADASHELKTPLTVIAANTDVVLSTPNDIIRNQERWLKYIKSETLRMSKLVNELLYIAKSDANEIKMDMSEFDISNTVSSISLIFESLVFEAGRELVCDISPRLKFYGDEDRIKQLVTILLDNAIKYSLVNSQISVSLFKNNQGKIKLCISNKCEELSEENVSKLFDRFYRVDKSRNSGTGGNGLGLNIAQNIAEAHNGVINVHYNYGMISFTVAL